MKRSIEPNIADRNAVLTSSEEADVLPNGQDSSPPATAHSGSAAPKMVGGSPEGRQTSLAIDGLANDRVQVPSSVAGAAGSGAFTIGPVSDPQLIVRTSSESGGSATASATSPSAQAASPLLPTASLSTVAPQSEIEEQYQLGLRAKQGKDYKQALMWFQKAAEQGHADAQYKLADMYYRGTGIEPDVDKAITLYQRSAELGQVDAQRTLGIYYSNTNEVEENVKQAIKWYIMAAEQGDSCSQNNLGVLYEIGEGIEQDWVQAAKWYRQAAEQGDEVAHKNLKCASRVIAAQENFERKASEYREAAEQGEPDAQYQLGKIFEYFFIPNINNGQVVQRLTETEREYLKNINEQAEVWYRKAAEQGHADAQFNLADMYYEGKGVEMDDKQALIWFGKAAKQGHSDAQYSLAEMYYEGEGVEEDREQAFIWYRKAAEQGHSLAQYSLGYSYYNGAGVEKNFEQAVKWFQKAADQGDEDAKFQLGLMYLHGWGIEKNVSLAATLFLESCLTDQQIYISYSSTEFTELFQYIPDILRSNPKFKNVTSFKITGFQLTPSYISLVDRLIRLNSNIQRIYIDSNNLRSDESQNFTFDDFFSQLVDTIQTFNTSLTTLDVGHENVDHVELVRLYQVLAQNQSIATLRQYLQQHPAAQSDELPREVLMLLADELIVHGCKSGQSEQAVKAGLNEFLMSAQAGRLNVPIRQPVQ